MDFFQLNLPAIPVQEKSIRIIHEPKDFYQTLLEQSSKAEKRICWSSLYLGEGQLERNLVNTLDKRLKEVPDLKCSILLDYLRGTRGTAKEKSSTTLLAPIADKAQISLYHTPELSGIMKSVLPERTNEIFGLQHMKLYIFDNSVLISGANLSDSYFTNRQDRYFLFENVPELADFFCDVVHEISRSAFLLQKDGHIHPHEDCQMLNESQTRYKASVEKRIHRCIDTLKEKISNLKIRDADTILYPLLQMGTFNINQEYDLLRSLFKQNDESLEVAMASGYFNCVDDYVNEMFYEGRYKLDILIASPKANGFYGASGASRYVPSMYSWIANEFLKTVEANKRSKDVKMHEWSRNGWTFHAKGLWFQKSDTLACMIGSSNYGYRSAHRDLEAQVLVVTKNDSLKARLLEVSRVCLQFSRAIAGMGKLGTHNGKFHCDEALACFLLRKLPEFSDFDLVRTRDPAMLESCDVVVDVGGVFDHEKRRYDHHQKEFAHTMQTLGFLDFSTKLSSAGLVYAHYGRRLIAQLTEVDENDPKVTLFYRKVYEVFIEQIDAVDNGIPQYDGVARYLSSGGISGRVGHLNPHWNETDIDPDERFRMAMELVGHEFVEVVLYLNRVWWPARELVEQAVKNRNEVDPSGRILLLENGGVPWKEHFFDLEESEGIVGTRITYMLFGDSTVSGWRVQAIPTDRKANFENRGPLPKAWRGLRDDELSKIVGVDGCIFVHMTGFIGGHKTREGAIEMAKRALPIVDREMEEAQAKKKQQDEP
ncbi:unnamed protein product, partial [Mesorhabditis belari]|uniref:CDP-diacylglycerol--glycerol-3-phosphate 3-phosphatidyltransferase n=1 Tax=Mesorhabditis belari TaxID=2138241 RepID=A0AAF3ESF9_9BILA